MSSYEKARALGMLQLGLSTRRVALKHHTVACLGLLFGLLPPILLMTTGEWLS